MAKFRFHRGTLADSMDTVIEVADIDELRRRMRELHPTLIGPKTAIAVRPYGETKEERWDARIGWDTHIVTLDGHGCGFTDGPLPEHSREGIIPYLSTHANTEQFRATPEDDFLMKEVRKLFSPPPVGQGPRMILLGITYRDGHRAMVWIKGDKISDDAAKTWRDPTEEERERIPWFIQKS